MKEKLKFNITSSGTTMLLALLGFLLMLAFQSFYLGEAGKLWSPILWLLGAFLLLIASTWDLRKNSTSSRQFTWNKKQSTLAALAFLGLGIIWNGFSLHVIFIENPIEAASSDIIPSLEYYVQRLLSGEKVYQPMQFDNYEVWPTYFPMMWLPYIVPELLGMDYRWMAFLTFSLIYGFVIINTLSEAESIIPLLLKCLLPFICIHLLRIHDFSIFAYAVELMPISYYILLAWALYKRNLWMIGLALAFCTLSRYAYTLWIIPFSLIVWRAESFGYLLKIAGIALSAILILYVIPFLLFDPSILTDGLKYYGLTADSQWLTQSWQAEGEVPYHLSRGLSFSYWFYAFVDGDHLAKLAVAKKAQLIMAIASIGIIIAVFFKIEKKIAWNNYLIISLFAYISVFYAFIYVPFSYLFMMPLFLGILMFVFFFWSKENVDFREKTSNEL